MQVLDGVCVGFGVTVAGDFWMWWFKLGTVSMLEWWFFDRLREVVMELLAQWLWVGMSDYGGKVEDNGCCCEFL